MENDDSISQEEIDNLMAGLDGDTPTGEPSAESAAQGDLLSRADQSTLLEVHNIAFGAAASTLSVLLGQEVSLSPLRLNELPSVDDSVTTLSGENNYVVGLNYQGSTDLRSIVIFNTSELKSIAAQMMAAVMDEATEEPVASPDGGLSDMEMDAVKEALNQVFHTSATSLSTILSSKVSVDITPLAPYQLDQVKELLGANPSEKVVQIDYTYEWEMAPQLSMCQIIPTQTIRHLLKKVMTMEPEEKVVIEAPVAAGSMAGMHGAPNPMQQPVMAGMHDQQYGYQPGGGGYPPMQQQMGHSQFHGGGHPGMQNPVTVQPVQFQPLDGQPSFYGEMNKNLELVMDVSLSLTVELGKTEISIKEVLELTRGSVIELDRVAGEPVDLLANGKLIAKGEVVVIEDNFGLRITSIVSPADRLRGL
jgi:flagellar motor switch protein FliN/FliY